jgi:hypothetical protein
MMRLLIALTSVLALTGCVTRAPATPENVEEEHERMVEVLDQTSPRNSNEQWKAVNEFKVKIGGSKKPVVKKPTEDETPTGAPNL